MAETIKFHDFIEMDYTGKLNDGLVFDTTIKDVAEKAGLPTDKIKFSPVIICVGEKQVLPGLDQELVDKEVGKEYQVNIPAENAFGKKDIKKLKIVPASTFREHNVQPQPGLQIDVDGELGTIIRVAGGRIIVNFNHPLAGKEVIYTFKINRKVTDQKEQITAFLSSLLRMPSDKIKVFISEEQKAEVQLPINFPETVNMELGKKIAELTQLKEVKLVKTENRKE